MGSENYHRPIIVIICNFFQNQQQTFQIRLENEANHEEPHVDLMRKTEHWKQN